MFPKYNYDLILKNNYKNANYNYKEYPYKYYWLRSLGWSLKKNIYKPTIKFINTATPMAKATSLIIATALGGYLVWVLIQITKAIIKCCHP